MKAALSALESAIGYSFSNPDLLVRALTHRSLAHESAHDPAHDSAHQQTPGDHAANERLEFLGDAALGLVAAESLYLRFPHWREGELTRLRAQLVSRQHLAKVAAALHLGSYLRLSHGEDKSDLRRKPTVLSNTMEAVLGAMFLDGGLDPVRRFVEKSVLGAAADELARELRSGEALGNYKSALQERLQADHLGSPVYKVKSESGPDHRKRFLVEVRLKSPAGDAANAASPFSPIPEAGPGKPLARGVGTTKKLAEQDAARRALARLDRPAAASGIKHSVDGNSRKAGESRPHKPRLSPRHPATPVQEPAAE